MIVHTFFRLLWVALAFCIAVGVAAASLVLVGALWVGNELRTIAPHDPVLGAAAPVFGLVMFVGTVAPALTALPAILAVIVGEALRIRTWMYYVLAGGAAVAVIPVLGTAKESAAALPPGQIAAIFAASGFVGGFAYWLLAGRNA